MVEAIDPRLTVRLGAFDRADIVRFAVVIPADDLYNVNLISDGNEVLPAGGV